MANINIQINDDLKEQAEHLFDELGMNFSTAVSIFVKQSIRQGGIPFPVTIGVDPFYNTANMKRLDHSIQQMAEGKCVTKTLEELEKMADE